MRQGLVPLAVVGALLAGACGTDAPPTTPSAPVPSTQVASVTDGDTIRVTSAVSGAAAVRFLNIDAPEIGGDTQEPWASASRDALRALLPSDTSVRLTTEVEAQDSFGRTLAHVTRTTDALEVNRQQVHAGHAALYVLWPNAARFAEYRAAQISAQNSSRGIWDQDRPLRELPFEYRMRTGNRPPNQPVGDFFTRFYVDAQSYPLVHVNNRVFFSNTAEAAGAGFAPCPQQAGRYVADCFAGGR